MARKGIGRVRPGKMGQKKEIEKRADEFEALLLSLTPRAQIAAYFGISRSGLYRAIKESETLREIVTRCDQMVLDDILNVTRKYALECEKVVLNKQKVMSDGSVIDYTEEVPNFMKQIKSLELVYKYIMDHKQAEDDATINILVNGSPVKFLSRSDVIGREDEPDEES